MIYIDYETPGGITDVGFVYTSQGDDTPFQLEIPAHNAGDAIFVAARGVNEFNLPNTLQVRDANGNVLTTMTSLGGETGSIVLATRIMWGLLPDGAHQVYDPTTATVQIAIHVYRGVSDVGDVAYTPEAPDSFGGELPALTMQDTSGTSRVWSGLNFNQPKSGSSTPSTPAGMTKRLTSPPTLGGGTLVTYDTTDGVSSFGATFVDAIGGAYYSAWAVEMKV